MQVLNICPSDLLCILCTPFPHKHTSVLFPMTINIEISVCVYVLVH